MAFEIARTVFTLAIRLIHGRAIYEGTCSTSTLVVGVDIVHIHEEAGVRDILGSWRVEMMRRSHPVQPHRRISDANLAMDRLTIGASLDTSRDEPEGVNEEVMRGWDVLISQNRDHAAECRHERSPYLSAQQVLE